MTDHIKIPDIPPIVRMAADGEQTVFSYGFPIFATEDLHVFVDGAARASGFVITGAGDTAGGSVTFEIAPTEGSIVTLSRILPLERVTDFLEGGEFSAQAINNELDYMIGTIQQVSRDNDVMLKYGDHEPPALTQLPDRAVRAGKALGFDGGGNPIAVSLAGATAPPNFTPTGTGAATRSAGDKFSDFVSIKDFGAAGDGVSDDTNAIVNALAAHHAVFIPYGTYLITSTITLNGGQALYGIGASSVLRAQNNTFNAVELIQNKCTIENIAITGGDVGIKLYGKTAESTQNNVRNVTLTGQNTGIQLDGYTNGSRPCYWNNFDNILIEQPLVNGVHLTLSGAGDTPNANRFSKVRVYSKGALTSGAGFYIQHGSFNNSFIDCEANMNGNSAQACFRLGDGSNKTLIMNLLCEGWNSVPNVQIDSGAIETSIINLSAESNGAAIYDFSGGNYDAYNAGFPYKNTLRNTVVSDLKATLMRYDTEFIDAAGTTSIDLSHSVHIVNATNGAVTIELPSALSSAAAVVFVKKVDGTGNIVTITEGGGGNGPDGKPLQLGGPNDYAMMISNGAGWYILASNRVAGNTQFIAAAGTIDIDMAVDTYLLSSFGGALTARLPPANAIEAAARTITLKKTDGSANVITISEQGGSGPDGYAQPLSAQYNAITVVSNGAQWHIVGRFS